MMIVQKIVFASHNQHKVDEVQKMLPKHISLLSLNDIGWNDAIEEPFQTFEENATAKALAISEETLLPCFADDSGLVIDALQGRPGIDSAHYAGLQRDAVDNIQKVLSELGEETNRHAYFISVIACCVPGKAVQLFKGHVYGTITNEIHGENGFGYDPIFIPEGFNQTFAELSADIKNRISHRANAMREFVAFLENEI